MSRFKNEIIKALLLRAQPIAILDFSFHIFVTSVHIPGETHYSKSFEPLPSIARIVKTTNSTRRYFPGDPFCRGLHHGTKCSDCRRSILVATLGALRPKHNGRTARPGWTGACTWKGRDPSARELHGLLIAFGWIEQNSGQIPIVSRACPQCYRTTTAGRRALKQYAPSTKTRTMLPSLHKTSCQRTRCGGVSELATIRPVCRSGYSAGLCLAQRGRRWDFCREERLLPGTVSLEDH